MDRTTHSRDVLSGHVDVHTPQTGHQVHRTAVRRAPSSQRMVLFTHTKTVPSAVSLLWVSFASSQGSVGLTKEHR